MKDNSSQGGRRRGDKPVRPAATRGRSDGRSAVDRHPEGSLIVGDSLIRPGSRSQVQIPVAALPGTSMPVTLDVEVVHGVEPGPRVWVSAAIHGDELNGIESIRRLRELIDPRRLRGALWLVPVVNTFGLINESRYLPDRRDLNRSFPGSLRGSLAARVAAIFMREVVAHCAYGIDLHSGSDGRTNLPQIRANLDNPESRRCALAFGAPVTMHSQLRDGSLRMAADRLDKHVLLHEAGEAMRYEEDAIRSGVEGALRVMNILGMLMDPPDIAPASGDRPIVRGTRWIRAKASGLLSRAVDSGTRVERGQLLGSIRNTFGDRRARLLAPADGVVVGMALNPLVRQGDAIVHLATEFEVSTDARR